MGRHTEEFNQLLGSGYSKEDAAEIADTRILSRILKEEDEDEQYLREQDVEEEETEEIDGFEDDEPSDFEYDEDEESELSFEDGFQFIDSEEEY